MTNEASDLETRAKARLGAVLRGKYRLDQLIGIGGMAAVYRATHRNQAEFAVKLLHVELSLHETIRTRFVREGYAANSVKHPGVVRVVDDDVDEGGQAFLVMDLLAGKALEDVRGTGPGHVPTAIACALMLQLLDVLDAAHAKKIVHRDIKPANLFLTSDGELKVLDFGIARARDEASSAAATGTGVLLGTPAFMSPEQAAGKPENIDARSDVWSAGATLFTLLTGEYVHGAESPMQTVINAATKPPRSLATLLADCDARIVTVVDRALAFDVRERWSSASAMRAGLRDATIAVCDTIPTEAMLASWLKEVSSPQSVRAPAASKRSGGGESTSDNAIGAPAPPAAPEVARSAHHAEGIFENTMLAPSAVPTTGPASRPLPAGELRADNTARPVSSSQDGAVRAGEGRALARRRLLPVASASILIGAVAGLWLLRQPPRHVGAAAETPRVSEPGPSAAGSPPTSVAVLPSVPPQTVSSSAPEAVASTPTVTHAQRTSAGTARTAPPKPVTLPPSATPAAASVLVVAPGCDPNFVLDPEGNKHFKPECFR